jgi:Ca2+-binding RTX toxin-like protein
VNGTNFADYLTGSSDNNQLSGGAGNDVLSGEAGDDLLIGGEGDDLMEGGEGADRLYGGDGNDIIVANVGADIMSGDAGTADELIYSNSTAGVNVNLGTGIVFGGYADGDTISGFEIVNGTNFADYLTGSSDNNQLSGGAGNDVLSGEAGDDLLIGGEGSDTLAGGAGDDRFIFNTQQSAHDVISDFVAGEPSGDVLYLIGTYVTFAEVLAASTQVGNDVLINMGAGWDITLLQVNVLQLNSNDFFFS